jgi:hypothetical protein
MKKRLVPGVVLLSLVAGPGCGDDKVTGPEPLPYREPTSPSNVVANLATAYQLRNVDEYAKLLAPEFIFKFQPVDAQEIAKEFWTRDEDIAGTGALFGATVVTTIAVSLGHGPDVPAEDLELPDDARKIRIDQVMLQVDETTGITWQVYDLQDMFFRLGDATLGENPDHWFLIEWRDIPSTAAPLPAAGSFIGPASSLPSTWGKIKSQYQDSAEAVQPATWGGVKMRYRPRPEPPPSPRRPGAS